MAKFLSYEDRLEIESGLKEDMTFTEIGARSWGGTELPPKRLRNQEVVFFSRKVKYRPR